MMKPSLFLSFGCLSVLKHIKVLIVFEQPGLCIQLIVSFRQSASTARVEPFAMHSVLGTVPSVIICLMRTIGFLVYIQEVISMSQDSDRCRSKSYREHAAWDVLDRLCRLLVLWPLYTRKPLPPRV